MTLARLFPALDWVRGYGRASLASDATAAVIVTIMLIPQSLAYAMLAGLPPEAGLYTSIAPLLLYALLGTSRTLSVGPVAVLSLMTASALAALPEGERLAGAAALAALTGAILLGMGLLRLGFLANFLSHPVISGFIAASALLIAASQIGQILGIGARGETLVALAPALVEGLGQINLATLAVGGGTAAFLIWARRGVKPALRCLGLSASLADRAARAAPAAAVVATTAVAWGFALSEAGVAVVGETPAGLPPLTVPAFDAGLWRELVVPALVIAVIGYVETISVAQTLAARRRQRVSPDQELVALGASNLGAGFTGGFPVAGGFARSVVNFDAGAETPAAGAMAALGIAGATLFLTPLIHHLPKATLAATILVAVLALIDLQAFRRV